MKKVFIIFCIALFIVGVVILTLKITPKPFPLPFGLSPVIMPELWQLNQV